MHRRTITGFTAVAMAPALLALTAIAALIDEPTGANVLDIGSQRELFVDRYLIDRLDNATLKLHEPQLAPAMTEPANNLEYGTVIKDGDLFRLYTREGRGAKFDGDTPEVTRRNTNAVSSWSRREHRHTIHDGSRQRSLRSHVSRSLHPARPRPGTLGQSLELRSAQHSSDWPDRDVDLHDSLPSLYATARLLRVRACRRRHRGVGHETIDVHWQGTRDQLLNKRRRQHES